jgi:hypothetical protein
VNFDNNVQLVFVQKEREGEIGQSLDYEKNEQHGIEVEF